LTARRRRGGLFLGGKGLHFVLLRGRQRATQSRVLPPVPEERTLRSSSSRGRGRGNFSAERTKARVGWTEVKKKRLLGAERTDV